MGITAKQIIAALEKAAGVQYEAAKKLGITRQGLSKRIKGNEKLQKALEEIKEQNLDLSESAVLKGIKKGNLKAAFYYLDRQGADRGYTKKQAVEHSGKVETENKVTTQIDFSNLTDQDLEALSKIGKAIESE